MSETWKEESIYSSLVHLRLLFMCQMLSLNRWYCSIEDIVVNRQRPCSYCLTGGLKGKTRDAHIFMCISTNGVHNTPDTEIHQCSKDKQYKKNMYFFSDSHLFKTKKLLWKKIKKKKEK